MKYKVGDEIRLKSFKELKKSNEKRGIKADDSVLKILSNRKMKVVELKNKREFGFCYSCIIVNGKYNISYIIFPEEIKNDNPLRIPDKLYEL